ncbi:unnamed protein product, partial [Didymodactylos carnosus]
RGALYLSIIGIPLPSRLAKQIRVILDFYLKYRHLINKDIVLPYNPKKYYSATESLAEFDIVVGIKLNFRPSVCHLSFERIKRKRPQLYNIIKSSAIYLIPKGSHKTDEQEYEFRLSFSVIEIEIAKHRSNIEQILNAVARSLYYTRLYRKDDKYFKSYVIKTIVFWMCEEYDLNREFKYETNEETIANILSKLFILYTCKKLRTGICEHYFIKNVNLLDQCDQTFLDTLCNQLENPIANNTLMDNDHYHFCDFTPNDAVFSVIKPTGEMFDEFHQLQSTYFDTTSSLYRAGQFDPLLNQMFYRLHSIEPNDQYWTTWMNMFLNLATNNENEQKQFDISGVSINDIYCVIQDLAFDLQRNWCSIDYLLTNNTITRFIYSNQNSTISYAFKICGKMIYDRNVYFLRDYSLTQILFNGSFSTTTIEHIHSVLKPCFLKETRHIQDSCLININENEQVSYLKDDLINEYWLQVFPYIILDIHGLMTFGLSNSSSLFSTGSGEESNNFGCVRIIELFCCNRNSS